MEKLGMQDLLEMQYKFIVKKRVIDAIDELTKDQRLDVFSEFCVYCGRKTDKTCHCMRDE